MNSKPDEEPAENSEPVIHLSFWQLLASTMSAFIGVQSNARRERDFKHGKITHFMMIGLLLGLVFVLTIVGLVQVALYFSGN